MVMDLVPRGHRWILLVGFVSRRHRWINGVLYCYCHASLRPRVALRRTCRAASWSIKCNGGESIKCYCLNLIGFIVHVLLELRLIEAVGVFAENLPSDVLEHKMQQRRMNKCN
jgi:hypothetical protein